MEQLTQLLLLLSWLPASEALAAPGAPFEAAPQSALVASLQTEPAALAALQTVLTALAAPQTELAAPEQHGRQDYRDHSMQDLQQHMQ